MSKPFQITYSPATWNAPPGGQAAEWSSPYGGLNVQTPSNLIGPQYSTDLNNVFLRNSQIASKPRFRQFLPGPDGVNPILGCGSFLSPNQIWHTFAFTNRGLFQLAFNWPSLLAVGQNPWSYLGGPTLSSFPVSWNAYSGILYYTNGVHLSAWDGKANTPITDVAFAGVTVPPPSSATTFGGLFISELANHILLAYTFESASGATVLYPNRIRWSNSGFNPTLNGVFGANLGTGGATFDPSVNINAGSNDFLDVPDVITGIMIIGRAGLLFRQNGITEFSPTGSGQAPFQFNHLWASQNGIGNVLPYSIAQYGNVGVFISFEQIYKVGINSMDAIGGAARDAILSDISGATGVPVASIDRGFKLGYSYLSYHLRIPMGSNMRSYVYSFEDKNWTRWTETGVTPTGQANVCWL